MKKISSPLERNVSCSSYTLMCVNMEIVQMSLNALRIHIKIIYVKIFVCEISLRLRDFLCSLRWISIYSVAEDNMTSTSCLYFSRRIMVTYHQILTKHTVLCFHCLCAINSFDPHNHSLQCLFQTPKDWDGENVMLSCYGNTSSEISRPTLSSFPRFSTCHITGPNTICDRHTLL